MTAPRPEYAPRRVASLDPAHSDDWALKRYWISPEEPKPEADLIERATEVSLNALDGAPGHGVGFVIIHRGTMATWVILWWWTDDDILRRKIWQFSDGEMIDVGDQDYAACVWELSLVDWERKAWINHVMRHPKRNRLDSYLTADYPSAYC